MYQASNCPRQQFIQRHNAYLCAFVYVCLVLMACGIFCHSHHTYSLFVQDELLFYASARAICGRRIRHRTYTCIFCYELTIWGHAFHSNVPWNKLYRTILKCTAIYFWYASGMKFQCVKFAERPFLTIILLDTQTIKWPLNLFYLYWLSIQIISHLLQYFHRSKTFLANITCSIGVVAASSVSCSVVQPHCQLGFYHFVTFWTFESMTRPTASFTFHQHIT